MKHLEPLTIEGAPAASRETLRAIQKGYGFIPNLMGTFAHAPSVLNGYLAMDAAWENSSFSPKERQLILLATSVENHCAYCVAAHSTVLKGPMKVDPALVAATRADQPLADEKLNALVAFTKDVVRERGFVSEETKAKFIAAGYGEAHVMEVIIGVALKTVSNYIDHLNPVAIDDGFKSEA